MNSKKHKRALEKVLYSYPALLAAVEGPVIDLFNTSQAARGEEVDRIAAAVNSSGRHNEKQLKVEAIDRGLQALTHLERDLISEKYFNPKQFSDYIVSENLAIGLTTYYKFKEQALHKMAIALNII